MDNVELFCLSEFQINNTCENIKACSYVDGPIFCFVCDRNTLYIQNGTESNKQIFEIKELEGNLKYIQHLPINRAVFLGTQNELAIFDLVMEKTTIVLKLQKEILDLAWDPIQSTLVLIDADFQLLLYTYSSSTFDTSLLNNISSTQLTSKVPESVMVGWGSQNTQFKGPKQNKKTAELEKGENKIFDGPPKISWRGNGEQFVMNFFKDDCRCVKVFDNQLNALFESDKQPNLAESVSFMGQGQYIASCVVDKGLNNLIIFEKNCKVKATFELKETQAPVRKILFHPKFNMLGILSDDESNSFVDIYSYSNGCWFLKQQLQYPSTRKVHDFFWIESHGYQLCKMVVFTSKEVQYHTFRFVTNRSETKAISGVISGKHLNIHLFENTIIPPPMLSFNYEHKRPINRVLFHPHKTQCLLIDSHLEMSLLSIENSSAKRISSIKINCQQKLTSLQIFWNAEDKVIVHFLCEDNIGTIEQLLGDSFVVTQTDPNMSNKLFEMNYFVNNKILDDSEVILYKRPYELKLDDDTLNFDIVLNACRDLYINNKVICSGVTSALLFRKYLLWTTSAGMLYCIRDKEFNRTFEISSVFVRPIEQGGRIVCCNNMTPPQIILQLPRGNLETIRSKLITIDIIDEMLSNGDWKEVLQIMRMEKINWNVLVDLNPQRFVDNVEQFVKAAKFSNLLTAIVNEFDLKQNCFRTVYKNYYEKLNTNTVDKKYIVEKIIDLLCSMNCVNNLNCIVALQQKHISLKSALISVKQVYAVNNAKYEAICGKAVRLLLQQSHLKDILNEAFTLYDLRLSALIYRNSNEDPKVYEPELKIFHNMNELERRFNLCLKAYNLILAVKYLLICDTFDEEYIVSFVIKNKLEHVAYESVSSYNNRESRLFKLVSALYAKRLEIEGKYREAGFVLKRSKLFEESLQPYKRALEWREVIVLMNMLKYNEEQKITILESLASDLLRANNLDGAVIIYEHYIKDYKKAIKALVEYKSYQRAINTAKMYDQELLDNTVIPFLVEYTITLMEKAELLSGKFDSYVRRLQKVREDIQKKLESISDEGGFYQSRDDELFSDTSSVSSGHLSKKTSSSRNSTLSSRNRRKEEKKKIDLREGGFYEDIALMRVLHMMYDEVYQFSKDVSDVCIIEELDNNKFCRDIHEKLKNLQIYMKEKIKEIWPEAFYKTHVINDSAVQAIIRNKNDLDPKYSVPPSEELLTDTWKLRMFS